MEDNLLKAYAEVDEILSLMENTYIEKIPSKIREIFKDERQKDYNPIIKTDIPLDEQNLQRKTFAILAILNLNYWCEDENEKQELIKIYAENNRKKEEELREKYNPDNIFKKEEPNKQTKNDNTALIEYDEENFIKKILKKIMQFFKKK